MFRGAMENVSAVSSSSPRATPSGGHSTASARVTNTSGEGQSDAVAGAPDVGAALVDALATMAAL